MKAKTWPPIFVVAFCLSGLLLGWLQRPAGADELPPPYNQLNLSARQSAAINELDEQWQRKYRDLEPALKDQQQRLSALLSSPGTDPIEISALQAQIGQLREQLTDYATANYLRKRELLDAGQQRQLERYLRRLLVARLHRP